MRRVYFIIAFTVITEAQLSSKSASKRFYPGTRAQYPPVGLGPNRQTLSLRQHTLRETRTELPHLAVHAASSDVASSSPDAVIGLRKPKRVLVLGASGFVGQKMCAKLASNGVEVVGLSRRGRPETDATNGAAKYVSCDAASEEDLRKVIEEYGPFDAFAHTVGLLLDTESGFSNFNKFASGSGSEPGGTSTYDRVTRQTAFNAIKLAEESDATKAFVFISAAEAGWEFKAPVEWLERYLIAKRAVEAKLKESSLREVIVRPSLIWTWDRPQALPSVIPFYIGNAIGLSFVDKPVLVEDLVAAAFYGLCDDSQAGILRYPEVELLSGKEKSMLSLVQTNPRSSLHVSGMLAMVLIGILAGAGVSLRLRRRGAIVWTASTERLLVA